MGKIHTGWVGEIVRVDDRVLHRIGRVDIDAPVAIRVLEGSSHTNVAVAIAVHEQQLDLPGRAVEDLFRGRVVDRLVSGHHAVVVGRVRGVVVDFAQDGVLHLVRFAAVEKAGVGVCKC